MSELVRLQRHGDLAVIEVDHPPVNLLTHALRRELLAALKEFIADPRAARGGAGVRGQDLHRRRRYARVR